jgi:hypothetical protein
MYATYHATYQEAVKGAIEAIKAGTASRMRVDHQHGPRFVWRNARGLYLSAHKNSRGQFYGVQVEAE